MSDPARVIVWNEAQSLLNERDRFTRRAIQEDFSAHPDERVQRVEGGLFATPVVDNRYTVFWKSEPGSVQVKAVLASELSGNESPGELKSRLERVFASQAYGQTLVID